MISCSAAALFPHYSDKNLIQDLTKTIKIYRKYFSEDDCKYIIDNFGQPGEETVPYLEFHWGEQSVEALTYKKKEILYEFYKFFKKQIEDAFDAKDIDLDRIFLQTMKPGGSLLEHLDGEHRYAVLAYMNSDYSGGELYFSKDDLAIVPEKGDVLFFHGGNKNPHSVKPLISGNRTSLIMFFKKNNEKEKYSLNGEKL